MEIYYMEHKKILHIQNMRLSNRFKIKMRCKKLSNKKNIYKYQRNLTMQKYRKFQQNTIQDVLDLIPKDILKTKRLSNVAYI